PRSLVVAPIRGPWYRLGFQLGLLGADGGLKERDGGLGREALDHGDVQAPALDDVELIADVAPEGVVDVPRRLRHVVEPVGPVADIRRGELAGVVLAVPGRQPDQAEAIPGALED